MFDHHPWEQDHDSDPEEADIEEHVSHGPEGSILIRQTIRSSTPRHGGSGNGRRPGDRDAESVMADFQRMLGAFMGPAFGPPGESDRGQYQQHPFAPATFTGMAGGFRVGGGGSDPHVVGRRFTYSTGNLRPRDANGSPHEGRQPVQDLATYASPPSSSPAAPRHTLYLVSFSGPPDQIARVISSILGQLGGLHDNENGTNLINSILHPAGARFDAGDVVYSQEALDRVISTLMAQHPTSSNAPGPASPAAIAALPKRKLTKEQLAPEGKGECSVCMDDVHVGDEVVELPCSHWFHEPCAAAWLGEHDSCPICRQNINSHPRPANGGLSGNGSGNGSGNATRNGGGNGSGNASSSRTGSRTGNHTSNRNPYDSDYDIDNDSIFNGTGTSRQRATQANQQTQTSNEDRVQERLNQLRLMRDPQWRPSSSNSPSDQASAATAARSSTADDTTREINRLYNIITSPAPSDPERSRSRERERQESRRGSSSNSGGPLSWLRGRFSGSRGNQE